MALSASDRSRLTSNRSPGAPVEWPAMPTLQIRLLGDFLIRTNDTQIVTINVPRLQALLAYLTL
jgi:hypothetical protein